MILGIGGPDKSGKTSLALTFPKPIHVFEFDIATVERAIWRFKGDDIRVSRYPLPVGFGPSKARDIKSIWNNFVDEYAKVLEDKTIKTISFDTSSKLWWICHTTYLQELQAKNPRERLMPMEYGEPNSRMSSLIFAARQYDKHLVLAHHLRAVYKAMLTEKGMQDMATDEKELDGFKWTGSLIDVEIWTSVVDGKPIGTCTLSGLALQMVGMAIQEPTYDKIMDIASKFRSV